MRVLMALWMSAVTYPLVPVAALILMALLVLTWYCRAVSPDKHTALPATDMQVNTEDGGADAFRLLTTRSPTLPPQPTVEPSGDDDCQMDCWSLCEKSCGGRG